MEEHSLVDPRSQCFISVLNVFYHIMVDIIQLTWNSKQTRLEEESFAWWSVTFPRSLTLSVCVNGTFIKCRHLLCFLLFFSCNVSLPASIQVSLNTQQIKIYIYIHEGALQDRMCIFCACLKSLERENIGKQFSWIIGMAGWYWWRRGLRRWQDTDSSPVCLWLPSSLLCTWSCSHLSLGQSFS